MGTSSALKDILINTLLYQIALCEMLIEASHLERLEGSVGAPHARGAEEVRATEAPCRLVALVVVLRAERKR